MKIFRPFRLDAADQSLWRDDQRVPLTPKAFAVLQFLVERAGRLVTQEELLEALWPDTFVQPEVLKSQILDVRAALGDRAKDPLFIETVPRRGYRFIAAVSDGAGSALQAKETGSRKLVGREAALRHMRDSLQRASAGDRQIVFVTGEPGMGKTTLVETFLAELGRANIPFTRGQCLENYGGVQEPYYPVLEALGILSRGPDAAALTKTLETHAPSWLIQLPALLTREHRETLQRELAGATRERMLREISEAVESFTSDRTLVLLFEDLHWADHSTVDLISTIAHRRSPARLLVLATYRPIDIVLAQHPLKQMSRALKARHLAEEVALPPLAETDIAEYLALLNGPGGGVHELSEWIRRQTEGNPLFMVTVIEHLEQLGHIVRDEGAWRIPRRLSEVDLSVPDTLRQMIELQIEALSPREQLILGAGSVHGMTFPATVTAAVLELDVESVEDTCQQLAQTNHIIRDPGLGQPRAGPRSQTYEFVHALFRSVLYQRLTPARRAKLHHRFGEAIEASHTDNRSDVATELAGHFEQAGDSPKALEYLRLAARNAGRRFAYAEGIAIAEHALSLVDALPGSERIAWELRFREMLSVLAHALYQPSQALPVISMLVSRAAEYGMKELETQALSMQILMQGAGDSRLCIPLMDRLRHLNSEHKGPLGICTFGWDGKLAEEHAEALAKLRQTGDRVSIAMQQMDHCYVEWFSSRYSDAMRHTEECLPVLLEGGQLVRFLLGRDLLALVTFFSGELGNALDILDDSIMSANKNAAPHRLATPLLFKAWVHLCAMDHRGVVEMCAKALPSLTDPLNLDRRYVAGCLSASAELRLGQVDSAIRKMTELREQMVSHPAILSWYWQMPLQRDLVDAGLEKNDLASAREEANRLLDVALGTAERTWQALAWEASARVALAEQDANRVDHDLQSALDAMHGFDVPLAAWRVHKTAAQTNHRQGREHHRQRARDLVDSLARSLCSRPALQRIFVESGPVASLLGDDLARLGASK